MASVLVVGLCTTAAAIEESDTRRREVLQGHVDRGRRLAEQGHYEAAAAEFTAAYAMSPAPLLLFNLGQVNRRADRNQEALAYYQSFLDSHPETRLREDTLRYMARVRARLALTAQTRRPAKASPPLQPGERAYHAPEIAAPPTSGDTGERPDRRALSRFGWSLEGAGLLSFLGGGVLWGLDGRQTCSKAEIGHCEVELEGRIPGIALVAAGGALAATGGILLAIAYRRNPGKMRSVLSAPVGEF